MALVRILLGLAISAVCVVALLSQIDLSLTWSYLTQAQPIWLLVAVGLLCVAMSTKIFRWQQLYYPTQGLGFWNLTSALFIGYMVMSLAPLRLGELVRAYLVGRKEPVTFPQSVGTILVEKVLDVLTLLLFLAVLGLLVPLPTLGVPGPVLAAAGVGGVAVLIGLALLPQQRVLHVLARLQQYLPGSARWNLVKTVAPFLEALAVLRHRRVLVPVTLWSLASWTLAVLVNLSVMQAMDIRAPLAAAVFLTIASNLAAVVPSAPGYVGVFHAVTVLALVPFGVDSSHALGYALVLHALVYGCFVVGGLYFTWRGGYRLADLWPSSKAAAPPAAAPPATAPAPEPELVSAGRTPDRPR
jgi:uncharacterized protein (TIRG00374 family)